MSPFGVPFYSQASAYTVPIGFTAAILFGLCVRFRPVFTLSLGSTATAALGVTFQIFLWFEKENNPSAPLEPNWAYLIALLGCLLGYGIMRMPFLAASAASRVFK